MKYELSVIVPCYNEEKNIPELVERAHKLFAKKGFNGQVILVDDASTDKTLNIIKKAQADFPHTVSAAHRTNMGMAEAWRTGLNHSESEYIALMDADLQYMPEDIWRLYRELKISMADIAHGYRSTIGGKKNQQHIVQKTLNTISRVLFNLHLQDPTSSFIVCKKEVLEDLLRHREGYRFFQILLMPIAKVKGYTIRQVEILHQSRLLGVSFFSRRVWKTTWHAARNIFKAFVQFKFNHRPENVVDDFLRKHPPTRTDAQLPFFRRMWFKLFIVTMPLHHWLITRHAGDYYNELKKSQWLRPDEVKRLQEIKLQKLVHHAYNHVPYYRDMFMKLGLKPKDIRTVEDLQKIPLLGKPDVRENLYFDMLSDNHKKKFILKVSTSGSTGEPFVCFADKHQLEIRWASTLRSMEWTGYRFGDRQLRLWHQTLGMSKSQIFREHMDAMFNRRTFIPAFELSDANLKQFAKTLQKVKPALIDGYAESFNFLAQYLKEYSFTGIKPKGIISSAQMLPDQSREIIEEKFNTKVFDKYGSREFSGIAYECGAHEGHHVVAESYIVEILKNGVPAKPGEVGEVVITDLNNFCMPFIRYRVGDLAEAMDSKSTCPCGRGLPKIGKIEGRVQAIIVGSNGRYIPGTFFAHFFKEYDHIIRQYQVRQEKTGHIFLKIIKGPRFDQETFDKTIENLREYLGKETIIEVEFVDKIAMVRTGKHQGSISMIKIDPQKFQDSIMSTKKKS
jgi:phenylacetate-CoA ligase